MPSLTIENYSKAIYQLSQESEGKAVSPGQIGEYLDVTPGTVTSMLKTLSSAGLIEYRPYEGARLTKEGAALALRVLRRHRLIELFLVRTLDLSWDAVHDEAENLEHAVSDYLIDRIDAYLEFPKTDPHGDPIPKSDGSIEHIPQIGLLELPLGSRFKIVRVTDQSTEFLKYLTESGIEIGTIGTVNLKTTGAGTIEIQIGDVPTILSHDVAEKIMIIELENKEPVN